jgi:hypothetical protein
MTQGEAIMNLGKWPTMRVLGERVTPDQAGDILICTAPWFVSFPKEGGWEHEARLIAKEYGMPLQPAYPHGGDHSKWFQTTWHSWMPVFNDWRTKHGVLEIMSEDGPCNNLISTTYRAWINWDGLIAGNFSIGKWPDQDDVAEFFANVAERFPYLALTADLLSEFPDVRGGKDETHYESACRIQVSGGKVEVYEGAVDPLILPDEFFRWQSNADWLDEQGVEADRLRRAFRHLTNG